MMIMMMMDERSKGTCFPSAEAAYLRLCFTYNHQAMSIYHQCHYQHSCSRAIQPDRKDTMIPPRQSACSWIVPPNWVTYLGLLFN